MKKIILFLLLFTFSYSFNLKYKEKIENDFYNILNLETNIYKSMLIIDDKDNKYYSYNENGIRALASLTKLMNAKLILKDIDEGKYSFTTKVVATKKASKVRYGYVLKEGVEYTISDLLYLLLMNSSNSAAYLLAENSSNYDIDKFIKRMNLEAQNLNLVSLRYATPHGLAPLDSDFEKLDLGNARDLAKLALEILKDKRIIEITKNYTYILSNGDKITSTNPLIKNNKEIKGLKTGYHSIAMYNIINYIELENEKIIQVILGSDSINNRTKLGQILLNTLKEVK